MRVTICAGPAGAPDRVRAAVVRQGYRDQVVRCQDPPSAWSYPSVLGRLLTAGEDVCIIEHDVESRLGFLADLDACPEPWCFFAYDFSVPYEEAMCGPGGETGPVTAPWFAPLGHTRFRAGVGTAVNDLFTSEDWLSTWVGRDGPLSRALSEAGYLPHRHRGKAIHWHPYP